MHARTQEMLALLDEGRGALRRAVDAVPEGARERRPTPECWSPAEVVAHLARVESHIATLFAGALEQARGAGILLPDTSDAPVAAMLNRDRIRDRSRRVTSSEASMPEQGVSLETAWGQLEGTRAALRAAVTSADGLGLEQVTVPHPAFGELNLYQWIVFAATHEERHAAQIRETAGGAGSGR
ncbi:MAG TPA: DinB family protein [Longimicrobium sp.]|jgi:hypothetical protein|uniref:DinB family protein n=1 Tax=Longimicrobium sp. TaxID=2029185 RepID=UPI002EDA002D